MFPSRMPSSESIPPAFGGSVPPSLSLQSTRTSDPMTVLRAAVDQAPQGVMVLSETGRILHANGAAPAIFGYRGDELVGLDFGSLVPGDSVNPLKHFWITLKPCQLGMDRPLSGRRRDGSPVLLELGLSVVPTAGSRLVVASVVDLTQRHDLEARLAAALAESRRLDDAAKDEIVEVRRGGAARISRVGSSESEPVRHAYAQVELVAPTPSTVLLLGETGSGKEVFAQAIHDLSPRHQRQMIRVSCAAIPSALIESELFGRERGAYTAPSPSRLAVSKRPTGPRCSSTRSANCRRRCRSSCSESSRNG